MDENNPPVVLPDGRVYSRRAIDALTDCADGTLPDPQTGDRIAIADLRRAFFL